MESDLGPMAVGGVKLLGLVAEPASPANAGPAEAGCLSGPAGLGGKIYGITSLVIITAYNITEGNTSSCS